MKAVSAERIAAALLVILLLAAVPFSVYAETDWQTPYEAVLGHLSGTSPSFGYVNGEWRVFALARSGRMSPGGGSAAAYYDRIEAYVAGLGSGKLNANKATENSRLVIALSSIGRDPRNVAGYDLIDPLTEQGFVKRQGPTGVAYALLALNARQSYGESQTKSDYVSFLLNAELSGGGWSLGSAPDPDVTSIVITALAPNSSASAAIGRGIAVLSRIQREDGRFETMGSVTSESCSQVVTALSTVGIDCGSDPRFVKNGNSALSALISFFVGEGFAHVDNGGVNEMASEQAAYALAAYSRFRQGRNDLYDMNDVQTVSDPTPAPTSTPAPSPTAQPTPSPTPAPTQAPSDTPAATPDQTQTPAPTGAPSEAPTEAPSDSPYVTDPAAPDGTEEPEETPGVTGGPSGTYEPPEVTEAPAASEEPTDPQPFTPKKSRGWILAAAGGAVLAASAAALILINRRKK